ncbi:PP0621 family protein [Hydrogenimonas sp.]
MLKILLTVAVIAAVYFFLIKKPAVEKRRRERADEEAKKPKIDEEIMVECEKCGTFVSSKEMIIVGGHYYCSKECAGVKR